MGTRVDEVVGQLGGVSGISKPLELSSAKGTGPVDFANVLKSAIDLVNESEEKAEALARDFTLGVPGVTLEHAIIEGQKAELEFQTLLQVRKRAIAAYEEIMKLQV